MKAEAKKLFEGKDAELTVSLEVLPTIEAPTIEATAIDATGVLRQVDFPLDEESATMSEVGTKLDLARA